MEALLLVDIQNDFLPGGALAVPEGDQVIAVANRLMKRPFDRVVATKDWHPLNHISFATNHGKNPGEVLFLEEGEQILWPVHCVQETEGAAFPNELETSQIDQIITKGSDPKLDSYSAFFDNQHKKETGLYSDLKKNGVKRVYVIGLATDYCVKYSVLDALELGLETYVIQEGCRAVELEKGDAASAYQEMEDAGAHLLSTL